MKISVQRPRIVSLCCLLTALVSFGCQTASRQPMLLASHRVAEQATVTTGGTFAHARTIAIPESGLSLADAIEQSMRPGVAYRINQKSATSVVNLSADTRNLVSGSSNTAARATKPTTSVTDAMKVLFGAARSGNLDEDVIQAAAASMTTGDAATKVLARLRAEDVPQTAAELQADANLTAKQAVLVDQISLIVNGDQPLATEQASQPTELTAEEKQTQLMAARSVVSVVPNDYVVRLIRSGEPMRILPLELVRMTPAGDIQLENGDRVELISYLQTSLGRRNLSSGLESKDPIVRLTGMVQIELPVDGKTSIETIGQIAGESDYNLMMDLMILRPALPTGVDEEYWFPRMQSEAYRGLTTFAEENPQRVIGGDEVRFASLSLTPLVRAGQLRARLRDRSALDQEQSRVQGLIKAKSEREQNLLEQASVIPGVSSLIETCNDVGSALPRFSL